ncbi:hypothetical protein OA104_01650 [Candidatus Pelagibacter sp.]|nr:hypothetical protein [Candidatus Pelagibacter sp.]
MLQKIGFAPGINKQITATGAEGQWTDCDNVRFRYGTPEKIGGWKQLGDDKLTGAGRGLHHFVNTKARKYAIIGTNRILYAYSGGVFYDIHPIKSTTTLTSAFTTTNGSTAVTLTFSGAHGISASDIILLDSFSTITGSNFAASDFNDKKFMVTTVPSTTTLTITMPSAESGSGATTSGGIRVQHYYPVGPAVQAKGFGWSLGSWGGEVAGEPTTTLSGAINSTTTTGIILADVSQFPDTGTNFIKIGTEEISYTGISSSNELTGVTRDVRGTSPASHGAGDTVTSTTNFVAWGEAASGDLVLEPGMWSLDNFGDKAICLIHDSAVFEWNSAATNAENTRASIISGAPTASRHMIVSTPDRHLVFYGTETTIGDTSTQDDMFVRFSDQEDINTYTPTATNTAGTQRLADGSQIRGAIRGRDAIYVWTDTALFTQRFVGAPFTFAFAQVGTNCGLAGQNACVEVDGAAYWMSENGFFRYAGKLESLPCLVEDFVFDNINMESGNQMVSAGLNNLFGEVTWFYPTTGSSVVNRQVTFNYFDSSNLKRPVWTVGSLARTMWEDSAVFGKPHALEYSASVDSSFDVVGNTEGSTIYYEHETGTDQVQGGATTAVLANISSGDFDITQRVIRGAQTGMPDLRGDGEFMMKIRRFIPDFISQTGNTQVTLQLRNYPNDSQASSSLGPFTVSSSTQKVDTRARARAVAVKIANTAASQSWKLGTFRLDIQPDGRR